MCQQLSQSGIQITIVISNPKFQERVAQYYLRLEHIFLVTKSEPQPFWINTAGGTSVEWHQFMPARDLASCSMITYSNTLQRHKLVLFQWQSENSMVTAKELNLTLCLKYKTLSCERQRGKGRLLPSRMRPKIDREHPLPVESFV